MKNGASNLAKLATELEEIKDTLALVPALIVRRKEVLLQFMHAIGAGQVPPGLPAQKPRLRIINRDGRKRAGGSDAVLKAVRGGARLPDEITKATGLEYSNAVYHARMLVDAGKLKRLKRGQYAPMRAATKARAPYRFKRGALLEKVLEAAEKMEPVHYLKLARAIGATGPSVAGALSTLRTRRKVMPLGAGKWGLHRASKSKAAHGAYVGLMRHAPATIQAAAKKIAADKGMGAAVEYMRNEKALASAAQAGATGA